MQKPARIRASLEENLSFLRMIRLIPMAEHLGRCLFLSPRFGDAEYSPDGEHDLDSYNRSDGAVSVRV